MLFSKLSEYIQKLENTASRNEITRILSELFRELRPAEIDKVCYLFSGRIAPAYEGIEFQLAEKMMIRAVALSFDASVEKVTADFKKVGDLGDVAEEISRHATRGSSRLNIEDVFRNLKEIALESGKDSQERKLSKMAELLKNLNSLSIKYVTRIPIGKLRLGFSDMTILDALSVMEKKDKSARKEIEAVFNVTADIGRVARRVKESGLSKLSDVSAEPGIPIRGSLAERVGTADAVSEKMNGNFAVEPKLDGFRSQIHVWTEKGQKKARLFSRNLENVTHMFPEIIEAVKKLNVKSAIFDSEAIAYNPQTGKFYSFQETVSRKRKHGIEKASKDLPLKAFIFDILYFNGETLLDKPFFERRKILEKVLAKNSPILNLIEQTNVQTGEQLRKLADKYLGEGLEGAMAKKLDVAYQAGGRGFHWIKFKRYTETTKNDSNISDTVDCVLMGAYAGRGKRAKFGVGGFLIGVVENDNYYTLTNLGTGLTDEQFREMYKLVQDVIVDKQPANYVVDKLVVPDIWVKPQIVLEILADEITPSPRHTAGRNEKTGKGYSLRFPRLIRIRKDKNPEQATSVKEIARLYDILRGPTVRGFSPKRE